MVDRYNNTMPTLAQYRSHYPNLSQSEIKLMHAARIAAQYSSWSLSHVRTVALAPVIVDVPPSSAHRVVAEALLGPDMSYEADILNYPRLHRRSVLLDSPHVPLPAMAGVSLSTSDWVVCKTVGYHSDDTDSDTHAYAFWCVKSTAPMTLMLGANAYSMQDGQLVIFDARIPHALLSSDKDATMVGIISSVELTPELRETMGIAWRRAGQVSLQRLNAMDHLQVNAETGSFSSPGL